MVARTHVRTPGGITATITCLEDTKGVAPVGRASGAWRRVPRQFATRPSDHPSSGRIVRTMTPDLVPLDEDSIQPTPRGSHGHPDQTEWRVMIRNDLTKRRLMALKHFRETDDALHRGIFHVVFAFTSWS